ncbi:hypothetical protein OSB04_015825 [Centaurea solstitialis]|uniref:DUF4283 domain-containing protein n=1 Tax=Centaurea solstitialis TaxID=347529 RepID=A0AA38WGW2_9ASTR|nr:hypothetical protein OSB04_015825 [Centaurea solstitialis]
MWEMVAPANSPDLADGGVGEIERRWEVGGIHLAGTHKILANIARIDRKKGGCASTNQRRNQVVSREIPNSFTNGRSFAAVLAGDADTKRIVERRETESCKRNLDQNIIGEEVVRINPTLEIVEKLNGLLIGECKDLFFLRSLRRSFDEEGWRDIDISFLGGLMVGLQCHNKNEAENFIRANKDVWSCWFKTLRGWDSKVCLSKRLAVVSIIGLPNLLLDEELGKKLCARWGKVLDYCPEGDSQGEDKDGSFLRAMSVGSTLECRYGWEGIALTL